MAHLANDLSNMAKSIQVCLPEREEATCYLPQRSESFETEQSNHHRSLSGETLLGEPSPPPAFSSLKPTDTKSKDPLFEAPGHVDSWTTSGIPFQLRHRFLGWLIPVLEGCCINYAAAKLGRPYVDGVLSDKCLEDVAQIDLPEWRHIIERAVQKGILTTQDFYAYRFDRSNILNGAEAVRHAWIHREDILMIDLLDAKYLPDLLGDLGRKAEIQNAFDLVATATANTDNIDQEALDSINNLFTTREGPTTQTDVFASFQSLIEHRLFHYAQQHHPNILERHGWTSPEQGEMPRWEEAFRDIPFVFQTDFADDTGNLLSSCLRNARRLRNDVAHRHRYGQEGFLDHVHNSIKTLIVLGDHSGAIEVEIAAEAWLLGTTRGEVLLRLRDDYLVDDVGGIEDGLERRREMKRRAAIAEILRGEVLPDGKPCSTTIDAKYTWNTSPGPQPSPSQNSCTAEASPSCSTPEQIILTPPDTWATRRETFSPSIHPALKVLSVPEWSTLWDFWQAKAELEWEEAVLEVESCEYSHSFILS